MTESTEFQLKHRHEWSWRGSHFNIIISCHITYDNEWGWCIYALIFDNHPLFEDVTAAVENLPWHGGCTYEERFTQEPARGIRYDWQRKGEFLKIGADYSHLYDEYFKAYPPSDGIPGQILKDAKGLLDALNFRVEQEQRGES